MDGNRQKDLIRLCRELIRRPAVSGREGEVARFISNTMTALGYDRVSVDSYGNVAGVISFSGGGESVLLPSQMDHVDVGDAAEWSRYPYGAFMEDGRIYGRAASDQKGALAAMIMAGAFLKSDMPRGLRGELFVGASVHQETFENVASSAIADFVDPSFVIIGEASSLQLERGQRGRAEFRIDTFGKMAHSSHPEYGVNAADTMTALLNYIREHFIPPSDSFLGEGILVLTSLYTAPAAVGGAIPEKCTAVFERRLLTGETLEGAASEIEALIAGASARIPGLKAEVSFPVMEERCYTGAPIRGRHYAPAWVMASDSPYLAVLSGALADAGLPSVISERPGFGTNGCQFAAERGLPTVIYGPSGRELVHRVDEYIEIDELVGACSGYCAMAARLLSPPSERETGTAAPASRGE
ncbi:MAG: YgeY family selenium metabolism-linked hydrolase [Synergistaceae bacterium]|nr:YgeY family selenium metabolism-linked hydrolase [Synergistaceae bacterium]